MSRDVEVPVLTDGVVTLREHLPADVDAVTQMCRDPEFSRWTTVPVPYERSMAEQFIDEVIRRGWREHTSYGWAIEAVDDDGTARFAGNVDIRTRPRPDIGFGLHPWARGRGLMTRAVRLATRWCFDTLGMPVMHWECHAGNWGSWRVAWACGFSFEGTASSYSPQRGELATRGSLCSGPTPSSGRRVAGWRCRCWRVKGCGCAPTPTPTCPGWSRRAATRARGTGCPACRTRTRWSRPATSSAVAGWTHRWASGSRGRSSTSGPTSCSPTSGSSTWTGRSARAARGRLPGAPVGARARRRHRGGATGGGTRVPTGERGRSRLPPGPAGLILGQHRQPARRRGGRLQPGRPLPPRRAARRRHIRGRRVVRPAPLRPQPCRRCSSSLMAGTTSCRSPMTA